jgi:hypothetical protein
MTVQVIGQRRCNTKVRIPPATAPASLLERIEQIPLDLGVIGVGIRDEQIVRGVASTSHVP